MIGTLPMIDLAPLDYRYALDAATTLLEHAAPLLCCNVRALEAEARQRWPQARTQGSATAALWIEPLRTTWHADLKRLTRALPGNGTLVIVASQPLARLVPERRAWQAPPLGGAPGGITQLRRALRSAGYTFRATYGVHSALSIAINLLSRHCERCGYADLGDRLHYAARLRYRTDGRWAAFATVALLVARKEPRPC